MIATRVALVAALAGPPVFFVASDRLFGDSPPLATQIALQALYCALAALIFWIVVGAERLPLSSIGIRRPDGTTVASGVLLWVVVLYLLPILTTPLTHLFGGASTVDAGVEKLARLPAWFRVVIGLTGGIIEELLYRGYAIERLAAMTGRRWLAATISAVIFGIGHIPAWGLGFALAADLPFGVVMTLFYVWRRDLVANMIAHSTALVVALLFI